MTEQVDRNIADNLPPLLSAQDRLNPEATLRALKDELANDGIALRLGRAFLQGRIDQFTGNTDVFDPSRPPPYPTSDECNLYSGGYQYDLEDEDGHASPMAIIKRLQESMEGEHAKRLSKVAQQHEELKVLHERQQAGGITLEILDRRMHLLAQIQIATMQNVLDRLMVVEAADAVQSMVQRMPIDTGKVDAGDVA